MFFVFLSLEEFFITGVQSCPYWFNSKPLGLGRICFLTGSSCYMGYLGYPQLWVHVRQCIKKLQKIHFCTTSIFFLMIICKLFSVMHLMFVSGAECQKVWLAVCWCSLMWLEWNVKGIYHCWVTRAQGIGLQRPIQVLMSIVFTLLIWLSVNHQISHYR